MAFKLPAPLNKPIVQAPQQPTTPKEKEVVTDSPRDSSPSDLKDKREHLGNGDYLIATLENEAKNHKVQLIERTDSSQFIRFYMKCSCGTEGRFHVEQQARTQAEYHLMRHPR